MTGNRPPQNEWETKRLGKFTASRIKDLLTEPKLKTAKEAGELSETAKSYILEKVTEIATGTTRSISTYATEWGNEYEPAAALRIKERYPDFIYLGKDNPKFFEYSDFSGGSPDGYAIASKLVGEVKCPENPVNHTKYVLMQSQYDLQKIEPEYYSQIQFNMMCVAKELKCDFSEMKGLFVSFCPLYEGDFEPLQYKELEIFPDLDFEAKVKVALPKSEKILAETYSAVLELITPDPILITGDTIQGQNILIAEQIK